MRHPTQFSVFALTANANVDVMLEQCITFKPRYAVMLCADAAEQLVIKLKAAGADTQVLSGVDGMVVVSSHAETQVVMAAIVGAAGLLPALAAARHGKKILLANKETLVMAGHLFMQAVQEGGATLLPIDSEHNAIFQVMPPSSRLTSPRQDINAMGVNSIILTASGGPFRTYSQTQLEQVTPALALKHPNWVMGAKITIDSSTLMNKGLEVIEAHWLFNARPEQIDVVVHPQSVIHSMVEYVDGSVLAQLGNPDMRTPIAYALGFPERIDAGVEKLNLLQIATLNFEAPDKVRFPCLRLAYEALTAGGTAPTVLNAVNEIAVAAFLNNQIHYLHIPQLIEDILANTDVRTVESIDQLLTVDAEARALAQSALAGYTATYTKRPSSLPNSSLIKSSQSKVKQA